ncbi:MAG: phage holin family protein [Acidobacteria bacterium]|nr:phage holin family protein [Acidobacteriota bacterium]
MSNSKHAVRTTTGQRNTNGSSFLGVVKTLSRLVPKQLNDEIALAKLELKQKGIAVGVAVAFFAVALVLLAFMITALIVAGIMALSLIMPAWLAALMVAAFFLVVLAIMALIGLAKFKKAMPLKPEHAIFGLRYDAGVAKSGAAFDPATLEPKQQTSAEIKAAKAQKKVEAERKKAEREAKAAADGPSATPADLRKRTELRRSHIVSLRAQLLKQADVKAKAKEVRSLASERAAHLSETATGSAPDLVEAAKARWLPLSVFVVSAGAAVVLLRKLLRD